MPTDQPSDGQQPESGDERPPERYPPGSFPAKLGTWITDATRPGSATIFTGTKTPAPVEEEKRKRDQQGGSGQAAD